MTDDWLNQLGAEGWELVSVTPQRDGSPIAFLVFKRPKP